MILWDGCDSRKLLTRATYLGLSFIFITYVVCFQWKFINRILNLIQHLKTAQFCLWEGHATTASMSLPNIRSSGSRSEAAYRICFLRLPLVRPPPVLWASWTEGLVLCPFSLWLLLWKLSACHPSPLASTDLNQLTHTLDGSFSAHSATAGRSLRIPSIYFIL